MSTTQNKKIVLLITLVLTMCGCESTINPTDPNWQTIEIGNYLFDFPPDFELIEEQGIDSYVGTINGDSFSFDFDFGYYSNDFELTPQEYLDQGSWEEMLPIRFMKEGHYYDQNNLPNVDILSIRVATDLDSTLASGCDYVAECKHDTLMFDFPITLPSEIKMLTFEIDTVDNQYRKIVYANNPEAGITGIYLRDLNGFNSSINGYLALSMSTRNLTKSQQEIVLKIFRSGRRKQSQ